MLWNCFFALFVFVGCASNSSVEDQKRADYRLQIGTKFLETKQYSQAIRELRSAIELDPDNAVAHNNLALAYYVKHEFSLAKEELQQAISLDEKYTDARNNLARVLIELKEFSAAEEQLQKVLQDLTYSAPEKAYTNLGLTHMMQRKWAQAKDNFTHAIELNETYCIAHNYLVQSLAELKQYSASVQAANNGAQICKDNLEEGTFYSAMSLLKMGQNTMAHARLEEFISKYPGSSLYGQAKKLMGTSNVKAVKE